MSDDLWEESIWKLLESTHRERLYYPEVDTILTLEAAMARVEPTAISLLCNHKTLI